MWGVDGDVVADEGQAVLGLLDFLDGGILAVDEHDGNLAVLDALLHAHDDGVAVVDGRLHGRALDDEAEVLVAASVQALVDVLIVDDLLLREDGLTGCDTADNGDAVGVAGDFLRGRLSGGGYGIQFTASLADAFSCSSSAMESDW